jgi:type III restriction enzyme
MPSARPARIEGSRLPTQAEDGANHAGVCRPAGVEQGQTTVMAMIITWQALDAMTYPKRSKDFSRAVFIVAPGLTVKGRLQVLIPSEGSYYDQLNPTRTR